MSGNPGFLGMRGTGDWAKSATRKLARDDTVLVSKWLGSTNRDIVKAERRESG